MNISVFGIGYVGAVGIGCLARNGHTVVGVDVNPIKIDMINRGVSPIVEEGIGALIAEHRRSGRIRATRDGEQAVRDTDVSFICVGTPPGPNGHTDTRTVFGVAEQIARGIRLKDGFHVIAIRSTVPPGTNRKTARLVEEVSGKRSGTDFAVVSNPEFLREGTAVRDYHEPPYTVVASDCPAAVEVMREIYRGIDAPFVPVPIGAAEMIKYVNNTFHALKVTFANEIGNICKQLDIDSHRLMDLFCMDRKLNLSPVYLKPGFAYGGSCLPKDLRALRTIARDLYVDCPVIENIERSNELQKERVIEQILAFDRRRIGFVGISFKAGTDDLRNSPIIDIMEQLLGKGFDLRIYDPSVRLSHLLGSNRDYIERKIPLIAQFITDNPDDILAAEVIVVVNHDAEFAERLRAGGGPRQTIVYDLVHLNLDGTPVPEYHGIAW